MDAIGDVKSAIIIRVARLLTRNSGHSLEQVTEYGQGIADISGAIGVGVSAQERLLAFVGDSVVIDVARRTLRDIAAVLPQVAVAV